MQGNHLLSRAASVPFYPFPWDMAIHYCSETRRYILQKYMANMKWSLHLLAAVAWKRGRRISCRRLTGKLNGWWCIPCHVAAPFVQITKGYLNSNLLITFKWASGLDYTVLGVYPSYTACITTCCKSSIDMLPRSPLEGALQFHRSFALTPEEAFYITCKWKQMILIFISFNETNENSHLLHKQCWLTPIGAFLCHVGPGRKTFCQLYHTSKVTQVYVVSFINHGIRVILLCSVFST